MKASTFARYIPFLGLWGSPVSRRASLDSQAPSGFESEVDSLVDSTWKSLHEAYDLTIFTEDLVNGPFKAARPSSYRPSLDCRSKRLVEIEGRLSSAEKRFSDLNSYKCLDGDDESLRIALRESMADVLVRINAEINQRESETRSRLESFLSGLSHAPTGAHSDPLVRTSATLRTLSEYRDYKTDCEF